MIVAFRLRRAVFLFVQDFEARNAALNQALSLATARVEDLLADLSLAKVELDVAKEDCERERSRATNLVTEIEQCRKVAEEVRMVSCFSIWLFVLQGNQPHLLLEEFKGPQPGIGGRANQGSGSASVDSSMWSRCGGYISQT